ncbi:hypothetical protein [Cellulomonas sp.]|uniref:hypothetical protein n=1 Tax=Cellulomonas sp. TaxID=40001 RepID=UPI003BAB0597
MPAPLTDTERERLAAAAAGRLLDRTTRSALAYRLDHGHIAPEDRDLVRDALDPDRRTRAATYTPAARASLARRARNLHRN